MTQLFDVIFADLRASNKNLNRILSLGILFALAGHFYVGAPYSQYKKQERILSEQHREMDRDTDAFQIIADCWYLPPYQNVFQPLLLRLLLVIIAVNSKTDPDTKMDQKESAPGWKDVLMSVATNPMDNYSFEAFNDFLTESGTACE